MLSSYLVRKYDCFESRYTNLMQFHVGKSCLIDYKRISVERTVNIEVNRSDDSIES